MHKSDDINEPDAVRIPRNSQSRLNVTTSDEILESDEAGATFQSWNRHLCCKIL